jgi:hypothetical protein
VLQVKVEDCPASIDVGFADNVAVTGLGCGGGACGCGFGFGLPHPLSKPASNSADTTRLNFLVL